MIKLLSDEWVSAEVENKQLRDSKREEFWESLGVSRTRDLSEIDVPPMERLATVQALLSTAGDKIGDADIGAIASLASAALSAIAPGSIPFGGQTQPLSLQDLTVFARSRFFTEIIPDYEFTRMD
ncbi:hypothetical protein [Rhizobium sp. ZPR3]|uniref:Uncharacterized protein n=2 Tax=unclassified Rhizobium TaxID=2613769 RepID=A0AAU7SRH8_9HYPH